MVHLPSTLSAVALPVRHPWGLRGRQGAQSDLAQVTVSASISSLYLKPDNKWQIRPGRFNEVVDATCSAWDRLLVTRTLTASFH